MFNDRLHGDAWHLIHISILNITYKLIIYKHPIDYESSFDMCSYVEANYMVTSGN
jgi:hypothetical protein